MEKLARSHPLKAANQKRPQAVRRRIILVDDHPLTRDGVRQRIEQEPDLTVAAEAASASEAMQVVAQTRADLVLVDISMDGRNGLELIKDLRAIQPNLPLLAFSMHDEALYAERVLRAGGDGYIMKTEGAEKLLQAVRHILAGEIYLSPAMRTLALQRFARLPAIPRVDQAEALSDRELEIFEWIGRGIRTREIAARLKVSVSTIETHRAHIKDKLGLQGATELIRAAVEWKTNKRI